MDLAKHGRTTPGAGYITKVGASHYDTGTQLVVPSTCSGDGGTSFLGSFGFQSGGNYGAEAYIASFCNSGVPNSFITVLDAVTDASAYHAVSPGDVVKTSLQETSSETVLIADDITTGADVTLNEGPLPTPDGSYLTGSLNDSYGTGGDIAFAAFAREPFNKTYVDDTPVSTSVVSPVIQVTNGVTQARPSPLNAHTSAFKVTCTSN